MNIKNNKEQNYFELNEHNTLQVTVFIMLVVSISIAFFFLLLPAAEYMFEGYLLGIVTYDGSSVHYLIDTGSTQKPTNMYFSWAVDIYRGTPQEARYWFNPFLSLSIPSLIFGLFFSFIISALLPQNLGYIRQKIERETAGLLDEICLKLYGFHSEEERNVLRKQILNADLRDLHDYEREWRMSLEDLRVLNRAIKWINGSYLHKIVKINSGLKVYLRFYFTERYSNNIIGAVYMGAASLIIIIGLRGLKFIPSNEPSLVLFALGLEFTLLMIYAFTLMYSRTESDDQHIVNAQNFGNNSDISDIGSSREVEKLLKAFVRTTPKKD
ncbi:MAG: hypothetical protein WC121_07390 [Candidatus Kapaibacterium sp.]